MTDALTNADDIPSRLALAITRSGKTKRAVARAAGMNSQILTNMLGGRRPGTKHLGRLAEVLEVPLAWLVQGTAAPDWATAAIPRREPSVEFNLLYMVDGKSGERLLDNNQRMDRIEDHTFEAPPLGSITVYAARGADGVWQATGISPMPSWLRYWHQIVRDRDLETVWRELQDQITAMAKFGDPPKSLSTIETIGLDSVSVMASPRWRALTDGMGRPWWWVSVGVYWNDGPQAIEPEGTHHWLTIASRLVEMAADRDPTRDISGILEDVRQRVDAVGWAKLIEEAGTKAAQPVKGMVAAWAQDNATAATSVAKRSRIRMTPTDHVISPVAPYMTDPLASDVAMALLSVLLNQKSLHAGKSDPRNRKATITDVADLVRVLGVGRSSVYSVISDLVDRGWLSQVRGHLPTIIDLPGVVTWFLDHCKHRREKQESIVPLYAPAWPDRPSALHWLKQHAAMVDIRWAITGWRACALHGLGILVDDDTKPVEIVVSHPIEAIMRNWQLRSAPDSAEPILLISRTATPIATFSGVGEHISGLPVVDPWQAALAVAGDPQRGIEQATAIADALWLSPE